MNSRFYLFLFLFLFAPPVLPQVKTNLGTWVPPRPTIEITQAQINKMPFPEAKDRIWVAALALSSDYEKIVLQMLNLQPDRSPINKVRLKLKLKQLIESIPNKEGLQVDTITLKVFEFLDSLIEKFLKQREARHQGRRIQIEKIIAQNKSFRAISDLTIPNLSARLAATEIKLEESHKQAEAQLALINHKVAVSGQEGFSLILIRFGKFEILFTIIFQGAIVFYILTSRQT